jgi:hypothetical protein
VSVLPRRRRGDPLPGEDAAVVVVPVTGRPPRATVQRAVTEAGGGTVAVVVPLRIFGSAWGFPNPGLLPNASEKAAARTMVSATIAAVERQGGVADGQITATRHPARVVAAAAHRRHARLVLVERRPVHRARSLLEGELAVSVRRRLRRVGTEVDVFVSSTGDRPPVAAGRRRTP